MVKKMEFNQWLLWLAVYKLDRFSIKYEKKL